MEYYGELTITAFSVKLIITTTATAVVGIATGYGQGPGGRSSSPGRVKNVLFSKSSRPALGSTQPPIQYVPGALSPGVKRPGRESDHSPPASAEIKKMWIYTSTPPYAFMAQYLIRSAQGLYLFTFYYCHCYYYF
jgi:hypothetical protein